MIRSTMIRSLVPAALLLALTAGVAAAQGIVRHPIPNSDFPIAQAIEIPGSATRVLVSGTVPSVVDPKADPSTVAAYGADTEAQTVNVLNSIEAKLKALGLGMGDIVKMQVYLAAPKDSDAMDLAGFMKGYTQFFGTEAQRNVPTRSVFQVAGLANSAFLVEIEVEAIRP